MCGAPKSKYIMEGDDAANDGVSFSACPYRGRRGRWWLEGWIAAAERAVAVAIEVKDVEQAVDDGRVNEMLASLRSEARGMVPASPWIDRMARGEGCA